jgi:micrococcal nuclease
VRRGLLAALTAALLLSGAACSKGGSSSADGGTPSSAPATFAPPTSSPAASAPTGPPTTRPGPQSGAKPVEPNAKVDRIVDGDTLVALVGGQRERVRLIGINTPESVDPDRPVMCFGKEASKHLEELVPPGTQVRIERDVEPRDKFGRVLGYVYRASDGLFVNLAQVTDGFANQYTFPPNVAHTSEFKQAAAQARSQNRGLWGACEAPFQK